ncbi:MAG: RecQ family ATP-dependent DNA helicase, partial [Alphaproteobacteria bacterium]
NAQYLTGEMDPNLAFQTEKALRQGTLDILFVAPERLQSSYFQSMICASPIDLIAVDEAHCLTTWGHDFRPDYVAINRFLERFVHERGGRPPLIALTATADKVTRQEISRLLELKSPYVSCSLPTRTNLRIGVGYRQQGFKQTVSIVQNRFPKQRGIIYCPTRDLVEKLTRSLNDNQVSALPYHAGLNRETRSKNQALFEAGQVNVVVATLAFGMGIDAPDLGFVMRLGLPSTLESFLQEAGRAGRDGRDAEVLVLYNERDAAWAWSHAQEGRHSQQRLRALLDLLLGEVCIDEILATHFGLDEEDIAAPKKIPNKTPAKTKPKKKCHCPACENGVVKSKEQPDLAFTLSELQHALRGYITAGQLVDVAQGKYGSKVEAFALDRLDIFGSLSTFGRVELKIALRDLIADAQLSLDLETNAVDFKR